MLNFIRSAHDSFVRRPLLPRLLPAVTAAFCSSPPPLPLLMPMILCTTKAEPATNDIPNITPNETAAAPVHPTTTSSTSYTTYRQSVLLVASIPLLLILLYRWLLGLYREIDPLNSAASQKTVFQTPSVAFSLPSLAI